MDDEMKLLQRLADCGGMEMEFLELKRDAERYRWLRTAGAWESEVGMDILSEDPAKFDAAVDAAMKEPK